MAGRTYLYAISIAAHAAIGGALLAIPGRTRHEIVAISMSETTKPKPTTKVEPPPPEPPQPASRPVRAKTAPPHAKPVEAVPESAAPSSGDALPDFGIALSNGGGGGLAIPVGRPAAAPVTTTTTTKTLTHAARPHADECDDPPAKPKLLSRPTPPYTDQARAAGIAGKVRVEITVDEQGHVVAVKVIQGLGYGLDEAAVAAARAMTFEPAVRCGKTSAATFKVGFNFSPGTP